MPDQNMSGQNFLKGRSPKPINKREISKNKAKLKKEINAIHKFKMDEKPEVNINAILADELLDKEEEQGLPKATSAIPPQTPLYP